MSNYSNTKATIAANVYTNHNNEVTAEMVKTGINAVVDTLIAGGFLYKGVATTSTNPGSPDANVFYIATAPGTYTNFGSLVVNDGEVAILKYNGSWSKEVTGAATAAEVSALGHQLLNNYFVGNGNTFARSNIYGIVPGRKYRLVLYSTTWDTTGVSGASNYLFSINYNYGNGQYTALKVVYVGGVVEPYYDFSVPTNIQLNFVYIGGRAATGEKVRFQIYDITEIQEIQFLNRKQKKTKADFVKFCNGYAYHGGGYNDSNNYEFYVIRAEGVSRLVTRLADTDGSQWAIAFYTGNSLYLGSTDQVNSIQSAAGIRDFDVEIPAGTKYIGITNRVAILPDWDFAVYYDYIPEKPGDTLWLDDLLNSDQSNGNLASTANDYKSVMTHSVCSFPHPGLKVKAHLPCNIDCIFYHTPATNSDNISQASSAIVDGDTYTFPDTALFFRAQFRPKAVTAQGLPASLIQDYIDNGELYFEYSGEADVNARNMSKDNRVAALRRNLTGDTDGMDSLFVFAHISDIHGDSYRLRNFADYIAGKGIDAAFNSGDSSMFLAKDYTFFCKKAMANFTNPYLFCIGNHESNPTGQTSLFANNIQGLVADNGYLKAAGTPADDCYYYVDFAEKNIRAIVLNYYNGGVYTGSLGQAQIDWFIATLLSTPSGYGVLVMLHAPEDKIISSSPYDVFTQKVLPSTSDGFYVGDRPIMHIIDAFIGRTSYAATYTDNGVVVSINADFSGISDSTIEFIAYVNGHRHRDNTGYYEHAAEKQLCLNIAAGVAVYGFGSNPNFANQEDLPRGAEGVSQDAFNIYAIDRGRKVVKVARIGSDLTFDLTERKYMEIPYSD